MDDGWRDLPLSAIQLLLKHEFCQITYEQLTPVERDHVTADEYAVLQAWANAEPCGDHGKCSSCGAFNTAQVRLAVTS